MRLQRGGLFLLGLLSALALPPINFMFLLWLCLPLLLRAIDDSASAKGAFYCGWLFGFGHFIAAFYWLGYALLIDAVHFGWLIPLAVGGMGAALAVYLGIVAACSRLVRPGWPRLLLFAAAWGAAEWARALLFSGFPWNPIASVWSPVTPLLQSLSLIGTFGLGVLTIAAAGAPILFRQSRRQGVAATLLGIAMLGGLALWGEWRLPAGAMPTQPGIRLRLVQANIEQTLKWRPEMRAEHLARHLALSRAPSEVPITHIIWPETAAPAFLDLDWSARQAIAAAAPEGGLMLVGTLRGIVENREVMQAWNSLQAIDGEGHIVGSYDKAHLVPFGEYVPLASWIPLRKLTAVSMDITKGPGPRTLKLPGLPPVGPTICYEDIFPGAVVQQDQRPDWLLNLTNDGWFGISAGPYQHFEAARMRAVEEGLPMVRSAYTGISAIVDPYGRVVASLGLGQEGTVDGPLPQSISPTLFSLRGTLIMTILLLITATPAIADRIWRSQQLWRTLKKNQELLTDVNQPCQMKVKSVKIDPNGSLPSEFSILSL